jgi:hypothetical protein
MFGVELTCLFHLAFQARCDLSYSSKLPTEHDIITMRYNFVSFKEQTAEHLCQLVKITINPIKDQP